MKGNNLWKILGFHDGDYEECRLLGCDVVFLLLRADVSEYFFASIIRVKRISHLGKKLPLSSY
jgi:hypothetical protein